MKGGDKWRLSFPLERQDFTFAERDAIEIHGGLSDDRGQLNTTGILII